VRLGDLRNLGEQRSLRFREKGGKVREIPIRHDLDAWLREYLDGDGVAATTKYPSSARPITKAQATDGGGISVFNDLTLIRWHSALPATALPVRSTAIEFILFALAQALVKGVSGLSRRGIGKCLPDTAESEKRPEIKTRTKQRPRPCLLFETPYSIDVALSSFTLARDGRWAPFDLER
jgi:hypothetical protein